MPDRPAVKRAKGPPRLLAVASGGGHWIELLRLRPAFAGWDVAYVSTFPDHGDHLSGSRYFTVPDATRRTKRRFVVIALRALSILVRVRPHAIVTTGSAPGLVFLLLGRLSGAKTLWLDSLAQPHGLSGSGKLAKLISHQVVAQWPEAALRDGVAFGAACCDPGVGRHAATL